MLFGRPEVRLSDGNVLHLQSRAYCIIAALVMAPRQAMSRAAAVAMLWPDQEPARAYNSLRQLLHRMKVTLGAERTPIQASPRDLRLAPGLVRIDLERFIEAERTDRAADLADLVRLYEGPFLEGVDILSSRRLEEWIEEKRWRFHETFLRAAGRLLEEDVAAATPARGGLAARVADFEPYHTGAHRYLIRERLASGDRSGALAIYGRYAERLSEDLGVEPDPSVSEIVGRLQARAPAIRRMPGGAPPRPGGLESRLLSRQLLLGQMDADAGVPSILALYPPDDGSALMSDGVPFWVVDDISFGLTKFRTFRVIAPYSAKLISAQPSETETIIRKLGVTYLLESRVHARGERRMLGLRLRETSDDSVFWAEQADLPTPDRTVGYSGLIGRMVAHVSTAIEHQRERARDRLAPPRAYLLWLKGMDMLSGLDLAGAQGAARLFRRCLELSPDFAPALSGLSRAIGLAWLYRARSEQDSLRDALSLADLAIATDPFDGRGHRERAFALLYLGQYDAALASYGKARDLNPRHADTLADHSDCLGAFGEHTAGISAMEGAIRLNPFCPDFYLWSLGAMKYQIGAYREAIEVLNGMSDVSMAHRLLAASHAMLGEVEDSRRHTGALLRLFPDFTVREWLRVVPNRRRVDVDHYAEGLLRAGLPRG
ncbi:MAG: BTAD domain-containing putative transcriptional regulator [Parvibaculaceae bacterium]